VKETLKAKKDLLEQLGTYLHHDAITGTAKQYVSDDYSYRMQKAEDSSTKIY